ncbi:ferredoxin reductase domain-containing protein [Angustibacter aerolatus]
MTVLARRPSAARHAVPGWGRRLVLGDVVRPYTAFVLVGMVAGGAQVVGGLLAPQSLDRGTVVAGLATALLNVVVVRDRLLARAIYWLLARVPPTWPFWARALACWLFSSGGLHAGWSVAATAWAVALPFAVGTSSTGELAMAAAPLVVQLLLVVTSLPALRRRRHDLFDLVHVGAPPVLAVLLWAEVAALPTAGPAVWVKTVVVAALVLYPLFTVRRVPVEVTTPSGHVALIRRADGRPWPGPSATKWSRTPFGQRHSFVNVDGDGGPGWRFVVARAGDWTSDLIDAPPGALWMRSLPGPATGPATRMFSSVVVLATGSGIGPALAFLHRPPVPFRLVWVTRSPAETYGVALLAEVRRLAPDAVVVDTAVEGKPDVGALVVRVAHALGAEAVTTVTNRSLSLRLDRHVRRAGLVVLSPTWDS